MVGIDNSWKFLEGNVFQQTYLLWSGPAPPLKLSNSKVANSPVVCCKQTMYQHEYLAHKSEKNAYNLNVGNEFNTTKTES